MDIFSILQSSAFAYILIPLLIFVARIIDVSIGTIRVIFIGKGYKYWAPLLGFFELLVWLMAIRQILLDLSNWVGYFAYAGGFAAGTFVGMVIEEKLSMGKVIVRIITYHDNGIVEALRNAIRGVTVIDGEGNKGKVKIIFTIINRQDLQRVIAMVKSIDPTAFYTVEDVRLAKEKPMRKTQLNKEHTTLFGFYRKGK